MLDMGYTSDPSCCSAVYAQTCILYIFLNSVIEGCEVCEEIEEFDPRFLALEGGCSAG